MIHSTTIHELLIYQQLILHFIVSQQWTSISIVSSLITKHLTWGCTVIRMQQFVFMNNVLAMDFFLCLYFALTCQQEVNVEEACLKQEHE